MKFPSDADTASGETMRSLKLHFQFIGTTWAIASRFVV
jgi:hypothetical protein